MNQLLIRIDFFDFFRYMLAVIVTIYATVITLQSLLGWYTYLAGGDKYMSMIRRYVIVQGLRLRFTTFWGDVLICLLLMIAFFIIWHAHGVIAQIGLVLHDVHRSHQILSYRH
jgi:hypothetical protein